MVLDVIGSQKKDSRGLVGKLHGEVEALSQDLIAQLREYGLKVVDPLLVDRTRDGRYVFLNEDGGSYALVTIKSDRPRIPESNYKGIFRDFASL